MGSGLGLRLQGDGQHSLASSELGTGLALTLTVTVTGLVRTGGPCSWGFLSFFLALVVVIFPKPHKRLPNSWG